MMREGPDGLQFIDVANAQATATVCTQGAQLTHWQPRSLKCPVTFMSAAAQYNAGKPIRAGIPICWPWFGPHATDSSQASHGFARNLVWRAGEAEQMDSGATRLALLLTENERSRAIWPHPFRLDCRMTIGNVLDVELVTTNIGTMPFVITEALHAYFRIGDIGAVEVLGLDGTEYADSADGNKRKVQTGAVLFNGEVDRVFLNTETSCSIIDSILKRRIDIFKSGSRSTVVWNPWSQKAARLADLGSALSDEGSWRQMVCIEGANALDNALTLAPGQSHSIAVQYRVQAW
jgi:D-hexose-6-phosphate mutarotase